MRYDPHGDPEIGTIRPGRPCYVSRRSLEELIKEGTWRRICRIGTKVTSVELGNGAWARPWEAWGGEKEVRRAADWWATQRLRAPASPAGLMAQAAPDWYRPVPWSLGRWLAPYVRGGWQETSIKGIITGPHQVYDIRRAYRWALTAWPMPERRTYRIARLFDPRRPGLHLVELDPWPGAPWPLRDGGRQLLETPFDCTYYGAPPVRRWLGGIVWKHFLDGAELGELVDATGIPACARSYWGTWIAHTATTTTWRSGKVSVLPGRAADPIRAHCITARVRWRLWQVPAPYRYVDSVITADPLPVGDLIGDWREVKRYPSGVWVGWPGAYGAPGQAPDKLCGIKREEAVA